MPRNKINVNKQFEIDTFYTAFSFNWDDQFQFDGESHDFWEIVLITDGTVEVTEDEKIYMLKKNDLVLHAPMEFHRIRSAQSTFPKGFIISFHTIGSLPEELKNGIFTLTDEEVTEYLKICHGLRNILRQGPDHVYESLSLAARLTTFLIQLGIYKHAQEQISITHSAFTYQKVISEMSKNVCQNISLTDLAANCNISVSYLKLLFKKYAGISPKNYYNHLRLRHAISLLKSDKSAAEIAMEMNFSSPNYFSVFFQNQTGKTTSAFRKENT